MTNKNRKFLINLFEDKDSPLNGLFAYDESVEDFVVLKNKKLDDHLMKKGRLTDHTINILWGYFSKNDLGDYAEKDIVYACQYIAYKNRINPIKDMLKKAFEECEELDPFPIIQVYLNIAGTEYNRIVMDLFFRGAIARIYEPGIQFDYCLDLVGKQGTGKTSFLRNMFSDYYGVVNNFKDKDEYLKMLDCWLVNDDELVASNKTGFPEVKRVITSTKISVRRPYSRKTEHISVNFVFARTTNHLQHLKDATGDRRFLPVEVSERRVDQPNQIQEKDMINIWGNYFRSYKSKKPLFYEEKSIEGQLIAEERKRFKVYDEEIERLEWYLSQSIPKNFYSKPVTAEMRREYFRDLEKGVTPKNKVWEKQIKRKKVASQHLKNELFSDNWDNVSTKIRLYMDNLEGWKHKSSISFGNSNTSGWQKIR